MNDKDKLILLQNLLNRATEISLHNAALEKKKVDVLELNETVKNIIKIFKARLKDME